MNAVDPAMCYRVVRVQWQWIQLVMCCHVVTHVMAVPSVAIQIQHWFDSESVKEVKGVREADRDALSKWLKCQRQCPCLGKRRNEEGKKHAAEQKPCYWGRCQHRV